MIGHMNSEPQLSQIWFQEKDSRFSLIDMYYQKLYSIIITIIITFLISSIKIVEMCFLSC